LLEQLRKTAMGGKGALILLAVVVVYALIAVSGPQGLQTLLEKHREAVDHSIGKVNRRSIAHPE